MLIVVPVAIKPHLHNVCAKNNYELLIAQEPAEIARSGAGGERREQMKGTSACAGTQSTFGGAAAELKYLSPAEKASG